MTRADPETAAGNPAGQTQHTEEDRLFRGVNAGNRIKEEQGICQKLR